MAGSSTFGAGSRHLHRAWHTLDEFLLRPGVSTALRERIDVARTETKRAQTRWMRSSTDSTPRHAGHRQRRMDSALRRPVRLDTRHRPTGPGRGERSCRGHPRLRVSELLVAGLDLTSVVAFAFLPSYMCNAGWPVDEDPDRRHRPPESP